MDLGAGYWLELSGTRGVIVAPASLAVSAQPAQDLGSGYWLEDGQIVTEGSR
jgi:hypothetical protein